MERREGMDFIRYHGVVLESARGMEPSLAERLARGPIVGSWWGHPQGHEIYEITQAIRSSRVVLTCPLARGRITYIHRRLWPFFLLTARKFPAHSLDQVREVHLPSGRHKRDDIPFPKWVPAGMLAASKSIRMKDATREVETWLERYALG